MHRRDFFRASIVPIAATAYEAFGDRLDAAPLQSSASSLPADVDMIKHCRRILEQNLLKAGERFIVATSHQFDREFTQGLLLAGSEIGAVGGHLAVLPKAGKEVWFSPDAGVTRGLTAWHWDLYASTDLLFVASPQAGARQRTSLKYSSGLLPVLTSYESKLGDHPYRTDFERINREGSKTRWLKIGGTLAQQIRYFPTPERTALTLKAAELVHKSQEIRVTSDAGTDFRVSKALRPAHAQYGIADLAGRWDNFGYGCIVVGPQEYSAEGAVVVQPGDTLQSYPSKVSARDLVIERPIRFTFKGGYVTKIDGGKAARAFEAMLTSYNSKESFGISHVGFGTHEKADVDDPGFAHHNKIGSILFSLGANQGHGLGGPALKYSGMGRTTRIAPSHSHFGVYGQNFYCDETKVIESGRLLLAT